MMSLGKKIIGDDAVILVDMYKSSVGCTRASGNGKMTDVGMVSIYGDDGVCGIAIDNGIAAVFSEKIDGVIDVQVFMVGTSINDDTVAVGCIVECGLYGGIGFIRANIKGGWCICRDNRGREWSK